VGQVVFRKLNVSANAAIVVGEDFAEGVYFVEARQGSRVLGLKLIKTK
jgi:hypothetical protein